VGGGATPRRARYTGTPWRSNGQVPPVELRRRWPVPRSSSRHVDAALERGQLTARGYGRVLRLARAYDSQT
jgi:magnesium chelatase family protein